MSAVIVREMPNPNQVPDTSEILVALGRALDARRFSQAAALTRTLGRLGYQIELLGDSCHGYRLTRATLGGQAR